MRADQLERRKMRIMLLESGNYKAYREYIKKPVDNTEKDYIMINHGWKTNDEIGQYIGKTGAEVEELKREYCARPPFFWYYKTADKEYIGTFVQLAAQRGVKVGTIKAERAQKRAEFRRISFEEFSDLKLRIKWGGVDV